MASRPGCLEEEGWPRDCCAQVRHGGIFAAGAALDGVWGNFLPIFLQTKLFYLLALHFLPFPQIEFNHCVSWLLLNKCTWYHEPSGVWVRCCY